MSALREMFKLPTTKDELIPTEVDQILQGRDTDEIMHRFTKYQDLLRQHEMAEEIREEMLLREIREAREKQLQEDHRTR